MNAIIKKYPTDNNPKTYTHINVMKTIIELLLLIIVKIPNTEHIVVIGMIIMTSHFNLPATTLFAYVIMTRQDKKERLGIASHGRVFSMEFVSFLCMGILPFICFVVGFIAYSSLYLVDSNVFFHCKFRLCRSPRMRHCALYGMQPRH